MGIAAGKLNEAFQLQSVNGVRLKTWFAGVGVGLDDYRYRSVPLFFSLRKNLHLRNNSPFMYGDIGLNYPWVKDKQKSFFTQSNFEKGLYFDGGIGYKVGIGKFDLLMSGGFSLKKLRELRKNMFCGIIRCEESTDRYDYTMKRVSFKLGVIL